jgi:hypothetical protein
MSIWTAIVYPDISPNNQTILQNNIPQIVKGWWVSFLLVGLSSFLVYLYIKSKIKSIILIVVLCVLATIDLWRIDSKFIKNFDYYAYFRKDQTIDYLQKQAKPFRVMPLPGVYTQSNILGSYDIEEVFGQHGNQLRTYDEFTERKYYESARSWQEYSIWLSQFLLGPKIDLLNTEYVLSKQSFSHPKFEQAYQADGIFVMKNLNCLPRARIVFKYEKTENRERILERIVQQNFDYRNSVILEEEIPAFAQSNNDSLTYKEAKIYDDNLNSFKLKINLDKPGILVLSENYYPAWKAYVNGKETKIYKADYLFRAIYLEKGENKVEFKFDSLPYNIGKYSTILSSIFFCLVLAVFFGKNMLKSKEKSEN